MDSTLGCGPRSRVRFPPTPHIVRECRRCSREMRPMSVNSDRTILIMGVDVKQSSRVATGKWFT